MRAWLIVVGEPLPTEHGERLLRIGLFADMLAERGWDVTWWTSTFDHSHKRQRSEGDIGIQIAANYRIELIHAPGYTSNISLARLRHNRVTARTVAERMRAVPPPDVIWCCLPTPALAEVAVEHARRHGIPVVIDVRDLWPDVFLDLVPRSARWLAPLVLTPANLTNRRILRGATGIVAISSRYLDWGLRHARRERRESDRVFYMGYPDPAINRAQKQTARNRLLEYGVDKDAFICCFFGTIGRYFNLSTIISAAHQLEKDANRRYQFVICGDGSDIEYYRKLAWGLSNVIIPGWVSQAEIVALMEWAKVGLAPYVSHAKMSLPNKPFEYMAGGLPVLSSLRGELEQILADNDCGLTYPAGSVEGFLSALTALLDDPARRQRMAANARRLYEQSFSAEVVYGQMCDYLEAIVRQANAG